MKGSSPVLSARAGGIIFVVFVLLPLLMAYGVMLANQVGAVYRGFVVVHVLSVLGFMLSHGVPSLVAFRLSREQDPNKIRSYVELSRDPLIVYSTSASIALLLSTGVSLGFMGGWWGRLWIWAALVLAIIITGVMGGLGRRYFDELLGLVGPSTSVTDPEKLRSAVASGRSRLIGSVGLVGLALILWLMVFKPF